MEAFLPMLFHNLKSGVFGNRALLFDKINRAHRNSPIFFKSFYSRRHSIGDFEELGASTLSIANPEPPPESGMLEEGFGILGSSRMCICS
jgi:hypothetical protein